MNLANRSLVITTLLLLIAGNARGQQAKVDSLEQKLSTSQGTERIDLMVEIASAYRRVSNTIALEKAEDVLRKAREENYPMGEASVLAILCELYSTDGNYQEAVKSCTQSLKIFEQIQDDKGIAKAYNAFGNLEMNRGNHFESRAYYLKGLDIANKLDDDEMADKLLHNAGITYFYQNQYDSALILHEKSLELSRRTENMEGVAYSLFNIGICYEGLGYYEKAIGYLYQSLEITEKEENSYFMANILNSIGVVNEENGDDDRALEFYERSLKLYQEQDRKRGAAIAMNNIGVIYFDQGRHDAALEIHQQSLDLSIEVDDKWGQAMSYSNMAEVYVDQKRYDEAIEFNSRSLELRNEIGAVGEISKSHQELGNIFLKLEQFQKAESHLTKALELSKQSKGLGGQKSSYYSLSDLYEATGSYQLALENFKKGKELEDSIFNDDKAKVLAEQRTRYETEKKEQQLALLAKESQFEELLRYVLLGVLLVLIVTGLVLYRYLRYRSLFHQRKYETELQLNQKLKEVDQMKSRFFANISHEFRTPLTLIKGPVEGLLKQAKGELKSDLELVRQNTGKLLKLVNQLLDLSRLEAGKIELKTSPQPIEVFVKRIAMLFSSQMDRKNIAFSFTCEDPDTLVFFDAEKMEHVIENLLSNAIKWTPEKGSINILIKEEVDDRQSYIKIMVADSGPGIPKQSLPYIFDRFYQVPQKNQTEGTGIGLAVVKEFVELHDGRISVESQPHVGTTFTVWLKLGKEHLQEDQINLFNDPDEQEFEQQGLEELSAHLSQTLSNPDESGLSSETVLFVDDNEDIRKYLRDILEGKFKLIESKDGLEALNRTLETIPDLVVSDVMMPKMDGLELCNRIKSDTRTSHIPVILLTAKSGEEEKIEGLRHKANDYIIKPFNTEELILKINNLIETRRKAQSSLIKVNFNPEQVQLSSMEDAFLNKLNQTLEENYSNDRFGVFELAKELGMSRSQLQRKINALTGKTPNYLIRKYRLEKALHMLKNNTGTVSEIAFHVGFSGHAYFSKCFAEEYGISPKAVKP